MTPRDELKILCGTMAMARRDLEIERALTHNQWSVKALKSWQRLGHLQNRIGELKLQIVEA